MSTAQTISGHVWADKEPAFAANIYLMAHKEVHAISDEQGFFELHVAAKDILPDTLVVSYLGYRDYKLFSDTIISPIEVHLEPEEMEIPEVIVQADPSNSKEFAVTKLDKVAIYMNPAANADPLKAIKMLPYSTSTSESANPELRGSSSSYSRVIVNGVPIYNPVRNQQLNGIGNFSLFNAEIIGTQYVYPSNPPLEYGNSIAGIVDIKTTSDVASSKSTNISLSLANLGAFHSRRINKRTFIQLYGNVQASDVYKLVNNKSLDYIHDFSSIDMGGNFRAALSTKLFLNIFSYAISEKYNALKGMYNYYGSMAASNKRNFNILNVGYQSDKDIVSINGSADISVAKYGYGNISDKSKTIRAFSSVHYKHLLTNNLSFNSGIDYEYNHYRYKGKYPTIACLMDVPQYQASKDTWIESQSIEGFLYARYQTEKLIVCISGRGICQNWNSGKFSFQSSIKYNLNNHQTIIASWGKYNALSLPEYQNRKVENLLSQQVSLDYKLIVKEYTLNAAVYHKAEHTPLYLESEYSAQMVKNRIYGIEISNKYEMEHFTFNLGYTYLNSKIRFNEKLFHANNDFKHLVIASICYLNPILFNASISYTYRLGTYYTPIIGSSLYDSSRIPIYGTYNNAQYSPYSKLDLSVNKYIKLKKMGLVLYLTITNLLNTSNQQYYYYDQEYSKRYSETFQKGLVYWGCTMQF
jgi:hypothetical protein